MDRDKHNRRRRERDRARRATETPEEREARRASQREYDRNRRATLTPEQRKAINASRRERRELNHLPQLVSSADLRQCTIDNNMIMDKVKQFHGKLCAVESSQCSVCLERFPTVLLFIL